MSNLKFVNEDIRDTWLTSYSWLLDNAYGSGKINYNAKATVTIKPKIKRVLFNPPATIVFWSDNTKTKAICHKEDKFSKESGVSICIAKKMLGNKEFRDAIDIWCAEDKDVEKAKYKVGDVVTDGTYVYIVQKITWEKEYKDFYYVMTNHTKWTEKELKKHNMRLYKKETE